jgi:hypothetical protein
MLRQSICRACLRATAPKPLLPLANLRQGFASSSIGSRRHKRDIYDDQGDLDEDSPSFLSPSPFSSISEASPEEISEESLDRLHPSDMEEINEEEPSDESTAQQSEFNYSFDLEEPDVDPRYAFGIRKPRNEKPDYPAIVKLRPDLDPEVDEEELEEVKRVAGIRRQTEKKRRSKVSY